MIPAHKPTSSIGKWLFTYKKLVFLFLFLLVIPIVFLSIWYIGDFYKYSSVNFDGTQISNFESVTLYIDEQTNHEILKYENNDLIYEVKLRSISTPQYIDEKGYHIFRSRYLEKSNSKVSNITVSMIIQTDWMNSKSEEKKFNISQTFSSNQSIEYNTKFPQNPLPFVRVDAPNLYIMLKYNLEIGLGQTQVQTHYIKIDLKNLTPYDIVDSNK